MTSTRKREEFGREFAKPKGGLGKQEVARLDQSRVAFKPRNLVPTGMGTDRTNRTSPLQMLTYREPGLRVFNEDDIGLISLSLPQDPPTEVRVREPNADDVQNVGNPVLDAERDADGVVCRLAYTGGRVPTLDNLVMLVERKSVVVGLEPGPLDEVAAVGHRALLILGREVVRTELPPDDLKLLAVLALLVKHLARAARVNLALADLVVAFLFADSGQIEVHPVVLLKDVSNEVVDMESVRNNYDDVLVLVVEARIERAVIELIDAVALGVGHGLIGLDRIVDDDDATATARQ
jgi:hypothetical protein